MVEKQKFTINKFTNQPSLKRTMLLWSWVWTIFASTGVLIKYLVDPSATFINGFTGIATIIGIPITVVYSGFLIGERTNVSETNKKIIADATNGVNGDTKDPT